MLVARPAPPMLLAAKAADTIARKIREGSPWLCGRLGTPESNALLNLLEIGWSNSSQLLPKLKAAALGLRSSWDPNVIAVLENNVGVFPARIEIAEKFCRFYEIDLSQLDMVGYWGGVPGESFILGRYAPHATCFPAAVLEPYLSETSPWSKALEGRKVLVIHPFTKTIASQYQRRAQIFPGTDILPDFRLSLIKAVQSLAGAPTHHKNWFEALESMTSQMEAIDFEVCLVGAGAYSLPLCAHAKRLGKVAIYVGGALQILFGIKGKRWDGMPHINKFYNNAWARPSEGERIKEGAKIEGGCYW